MFVNSCEKDVTIAVQNREQLLLSIQKLEGEIAEKEYQKRLALQNAESLRLRHRERQIDVEETKKRAEELSETLSRMHAEKESSDSHAASMRAKLQTQNETLYALQGEKTRL